MTRRGWILLIAAAILVAAIAYQNRMERVALAIGPLRLFGIPVVVIACAAFLLGMTAMYLVSLPTDRRIRELLRAHGLLDAPLDAPAPRSGRPVQHVTHSDPTSPPSAGYPHS
ncbi:MAG TPA: hypothetical protein VFS20_28900 [Longimicrobium sp.]|nr:hypothetical protein [Longimicrobium sp.]